MTRWRPRIWFAATGLGLLGTYVYYLLLYFAYARGTGLEVLVLQYSWPVFVAILSVAILGERLTPNRTVVLGVLGVSDQRPFRPSKKGRV